MEKEDNPMEETNESNENENSVTPSSSDNVNKEEETAEELMTDMKLEDETDYMREMGPGENWIYHIEVFPWSVDDMAENLTKVIKLASFSNIVMKKKRVTKTNDQERLDDNVQKRQRRGCLHLYVDTWHTAKTIMRSLTWKSMNEKELTFEITRQYPEDGHTETGEVNDRSARISNIPGTISREFLDVVFSRAHVAYGDSASDKSNNKDTNLQHKLQEMENFNGSLDLDCFSKGNCRSLVLAYKSLFICGQKVILTAVNEQTMVAPASPNVVAAKGKKGSATKESSSHTSQSCNTTSFRGQSRGRGATHIPDGTSLGRGHQREMSAPASRARGMGRASAASLRPASATLPRAGHGMPVPMTGRQKMNEKLRRLNLGSAAGPPFLMSGTAGGGRASGMGSVGDSFKQEIASLQNQLERSTQALEAQIARLKQESSYFNEDIRGYKDNQWTDSHFDYGEEEESAFMYDNYGVGALPRGDFGALQNQKPRYQTGFPQQGLPNRRGATHNINMHVSSPSGQQAASRIQRMQPGSRGSEFRRGGRGRSMASSKNEMAWSSSSNVFW